MTQEILISDVLIIMMLIPSLAMAENILAATPEWERMPTPMMETLVVIAYRQPVTRAQIEGVRGVDCSGVLRSLIQRGLVEESGRLEVVGRPLLYSVTELFMQHFGLPNLGELPPLASSEEALLQLKTQFAELGETMAETSTPAGA